ncbi:major facilitator superfamily protein [Pelomyxa schiedti]|nr:major facilitator superfamily protein [Pelomyxa schiedti]
MVMVILADLYMMDGSGLEGGSGWGDALVASAALVGTIVGQLVFGILGDIIGRRIALTLTSVIIVLSCLTCAVGVSGNAESVYVKLAVCRLLLGLGIGGEYPLCSAAVVESSPEKSRAQRAAFVFSMQGLGNLLAPLVVLLLLELGISLNLVWRFALAFGAIPCLSTMYQRATMPDTRKQSCQISDNPHLAYSKMRLLKESLPVLIGTSVPWFLFDAMFYANALFKEEVVNLLGAKEWGRAAGSLQDLSATRTQLEKTALESLSIAFMALPGFVIAVSLIERVGCKKLQLVGFASASVLFTGMSMWFDWLSLHPALFVITYAFTFVVSNAGPNTTTFVLAAESFPANIRTTCSGISAAIGKCGAVVGALAFAPLAHSYGPQAAFAVCACCAACAFGATHFFVEGNRQSEPLHRESSP